MRTDFDAVVVGAGPAGTSTAYRLRQYGYKVLLLEKQRFPRVKPCGGGITIKALNLLPWSIAPVLERAVKQIRMGVNSAAGKRSEVFEAEGYVCTFAQREEFDRFNLERTIEAGVDFEHTSELSAIDEHRDHVSVAIGQRPVTTRFVVGADGANSAVRRILNAGRNFYRGFAIEGLVDYADIDHEPTTEFFFGYVESGYGWLFPKGDHVNVGIYTCDSDVSLSKEQLRAYALDRLGTEKLQGIVGFPIGFGGRHYVPNRERIILTGDAGGFAEPLLGEGIHNALKSGQAAASAIASVDSGNSQNLRLAYRKFLSPLTNDLICCEELAHRFYPNLAGIAFDALSFPISKTALMRGFAAGMTMFDITNPFQLSLLRLYSPFYQPMEPAGLREFLRNTGGQPRAAGATIS